MNAEVLEVWKPAVNRLGYDVSTKGRMRCYWTKYKRKKKLEKEPWLLKLKMTGDSYAQINMRGVVENVHIIMLETFVGPRPVIPGKKIEARHLNDVKSDNRLENLVWGIQEDNIADAVRNGKIKLGRDRKNTKASEETALKVRELWATGQHFQKDLAKMFGLTKGIVQSICCGETWKYLPMGDKPPRKVTKEKADYILAEVAKGRSQTSVKREVGLSGAVVSMICNGEYKPLLQNRE